MDLHFHCAIIEERTPSFRGAMRLYEDALSRELPADKKERNQKPQAKRNRKEKLFEKKGN